MKSYAWWLCLAVVVAGLALAGTVRVLAVEDEANQQQSASAMQGATGLKQPPIRVTVSPAMEGVIWHALRILKFNLLIILACHVLLAVWVFMDIRKRGEGNGIFIALALLAGFCGAILYALVRLVDMKKA